MRVAFFTPLSPLRTAVADHSEGLLPHLAKMADVDLFIEDGYAPSNSQISDSFEVFSARLFPMRARDYEAVLYAMGQNADIHGYVYDTLREFPGVVILHDVTLHRMMINLAAKRDRMGMYLGAMEDTYGFADARIPHRIISGYGESYVRQYPLIEPVVDSSLAVVVHNDYARHEVLRVCPRAHVTKINQHFFLPSGPANHGDREDLRLRWGLRGRFVVGTCGIIVPHKRVEVCLQAFKRFRERYPDASYLFVGGCPGDFDLRGTIERLGLENHVRVTGWLDPAEFTQHMRLLDVAIHLRYPHIGGTPYTPIRLMGLAIPTILSDIEPLAELPEGACVKIPVGPFEEDMLLKVLISLREDEELRTELGRNGARWIGEHHDVASIAGQYVSVLREASDMDAPVESRC
jgi:glycosyltransferase involved in cell wall biosynthesis